MPAEVEVGVSVTVNAGNCSSMGMSSSSLSGDCKSAGGEPAKIK